MESSLLGLVTDTNIIIDAERKQLPVAGLIEAIYNAFGPLRLCLSPLTVGELVHGIYRARTPSQAVKRRAYLEELLKVIPCPPVTVRTGWIIGEIEGREAAKGNVLAYDDLLIAATAIEYSYGILTNNHRHFQRIPELTVVSLDL